MTSTVSKIEELVDEFAKKLLQNGVELDEQREGLKVLASYYGHLKKAQGRSDDDPDDVVTMGALQDELRRAEEVTNGSGTVPHRRGRGNRTRPAEDLDS